MAEYVIGCDEAGRGCLLGALVMTAFAVVAKDERKLTDAGARDSKVMTPKQREDSREKLLKMGLHRTRLITATEINDAMGKRVSLNELEARELALMLAEFAVELEKAGSTVKTIFVDSPDPVPVKYAQRLRKNAPALSKYEIVSENHSESKHPCIAAASVVAKTTRDAELEKIKDIFGEDFGTGYTHDARTIDFARRHLRDVRLEPFLRTKWKTVRNLESVQVDLNKYL